MKVKRIMKSMLVIACVICLSFRSVSPALAKTWRFGKDTYGGGNETSPYRVTATTWSNTTAVLRAEVYELVGAVDLYQPWVSWPRTSKTVTGNNVSTTEFAPSNVLLINSTTRHYFNSTMNEIKEFATY